MTASTTPRVPRPLPVVGYALRFARPPLSLVETPRSVGDVVPIRLGPQTVYWVKDPELVRRVLTELVVVLATIAQRWRLAPVPGVPVRIDSTSVLKPERLPMTPHRRG